MRKSFTKIQFSTLLLAFFISCNSIKYVPENEFLLNKNTILVNEKSKSKSKLDNYLVQKPNQKVFGVPASLYLYNIGDLNFEGTFAEWRDNHPNKSKSFDNVFSEEELKGWEERLHRFLSVRGTR